MKNMYEKMNFISTIEKRYSSYQLDLLKKHLNNRFLQKSQKADLSIVHDLLYECNLTCIGCGVSSRFVKKSECIPKKLLNPSYEQISIVLKKIKDYVDKAHKTLFIYFGGGEPFLRDDLEGVLLNASELFSSKSIGLDTNGTIPNTYERICNIEKYLSYLSISLDGFEEYHNWWRGGLKPLNPFQKTIDLIKKISTQSPHLLSKVRIKSVATKKNLTQIPELLKYLGDFGIKHYSIHRAMPVGRMEKQMALIPSSDEYLELLIKSIEQGIKRDIKVHLHHSIESIFASILLNLNTFEKYSIGNPDKGSSLGIDPEGTVFYDPWCVSGIFKKIKGINLLDNNVLFEDVFNENMNSIINRLDREKTSHGRCYGCKFPCSGGSRVAAIAYHIKKNKISDLSENAIMEGFKQVDPACPFFKSENQI